MKHRCWMWLIVLFLLALTLACSGGKTATPEIVTPAPKTQAPEETQAPTPRPTLTPRPTATPRPTPTTKPVATATATMPPPDDNASLEIFNEGTKELAEVFISPQTSDSWGANWIADTIPIGGNFTIWDIEPEAYDIKFVYSDESTAEILYNVWLEGENYLTVYGKASIPDNAVLRFEEDFTDNRNNWGDSYTDDVDYPPPADGEYCMTIKVDHMIAWEWYEPFRPSDFFAEVKCTVDPDTDTSCGLGFGPDGDNLFWYEIDPENQSYAVFLLQNDEWQDDLVSWTNDNHIDPSGKNYLALGRIAGTLYIYVNGNLINQVDTDLFPTGRIGIGGSAYDDANVTICLDNLRVWRIE